MLVGETNVQSAVYDSGQAPHSALRLMYWTFNLIHHPKTLTSLHVLNRNHFKQKLLMLIDFAGIVDIHGLADSSYCSTLGVISQQ